MQGKELELELQTLSKAVLDAHIEYSKAVGLCCEAEDKKSIVLNTCRNEAELLASGKVTEAKFDRMARANPVYEKAVEDFAMAKSIMVKLEAEYENALRMYEIKMLLAGLE